MTALAPLIDCHNLSVYRGDRLVLDGVNLTVGVGEHIAILGPNGCGKSTLIKTFTRELYTAPRRGDSWMRIMGQDAWDVTTLRKMLGIVTNDLVAECTKGMSSDFAELPRRVSSRDTILSGFFSSIGVWGHHHVTAAMQQKTDEILELLEIPHLSERPLHELSSGEVRRVVIGRALVHDPQALVLDEPTNSLDLRAMYELREIVRKIAQAGMTIILVTHHLPDIIPEIDRVIMLRGGKLVADGRKREMLTSEQLSGLFGVPLEAAERGGYFQLW